MNILEQALRTVVAEEVAKAEKRILESLSAATDRTLSFTEAYQSLHMSESSLRNLVRAKRIPHRSVGAEGSKRPTYLFSSVSLEKWKKEEEMKNYQIV